MAHKLIGHRINFHTMNITTSSFARYLSPYFTHYFSSRLKGCILFIQLLERIAYYLFRFSFILYLITKKNEGGLELTEKNGIALSTLYYGIAHFLTLIGGMCSDRCLGDRRAILVGACFSFAGYLFCSFYSAYTSPTPICFFLIALFFTECGYGLLKPSMASYLGKCYSYTAEKRERGFSLSYLCSPLGACLGGFLAGLIKKFWGFSLLFGIGSIFFCSIFLITIFLPTVSPSSPSLKKASELNERKNSTGNRQKIPSLIHFVDFFQIIWESLSQTFFSLFGRKRAEHSHLYAASNTKQNSTSAGMSLLFFFALIHYSTHLLYNGLMILYLKNYIDRKLFGWEIPVAWFASFQLPLQLLMIITIPIGWKRWEKYHQTVIPISKKLAVGSIASSFAFFLMALLSLSTISSETSLIEKGEMFPIIVNYLFFLFSGACINPLLWSAMFYLAPRQHKALSMSLIMIAISLGGILPSCILLILPSFRFSLCFFSMALTSSLLSLMFWKNRRLQMSLHGYEDKI